MAGKNIALEWDDDSGKYLGADGSFFTPYEVEKLQTYEAGVNTYTTVGGPLKGSIAAPPNPLAGPQGLIPAPMKRWIWSGKKETRHRGMSGEEQIVYTPFSNGLQYPGDPAAPAKETANCKCSMEVFRGEATRKDISNMAREAELLDKELQSSMRQAMTQAQEDAVYEYRGNGFDQINGFLRGKPGYGALPGGQRAENLSFFIDGMDSLIRSSKTKKQLTAWRGGGKSDAASMKRKFGSSNPEDLVGTIIRDDAFTSATVNGKEAEFFGKVIIHMNVPKGTPALYMNGVDATSTYSAEMEIVFSRGQGLLVKKVQKTKLGDQYRYDIFADVVDIKPGKLSRPKKMPTSTKQVEVMTSSIKNLQSYLMKNKGKMQPTEVSQSASYLGKAGAFAAKGDFELATVYYDNAFQIIYPYLDS